MKEKSKRRITRKQALDVLLGAKRPDLELLKYSRIYIIKTLNGALLISAEGAEAFVYDDDDLDGLRSLHYSIDGALGCWGSKHNKQRLHHVIEHGNSYECQDKDCPICAEKRWNREEIHDRGSEERSKDEAKDDQKTQADASDA